MSARELKTKLKKFVKTHKKELVAEGCCLCKYDDGYPEDCFQYVELCSIKICGKNRPVELWADSCSGDESIRLCFSVDFCERMNSESFLQYAMDKHLPIYLFDKSPRNYRINHLNSLIAEYTSDNYDYEGRLAYRITTRLDSDELKNIGRGQDNWRFISYYFSDENDGASIAIKHFFENILPCLDETVLDDTTRKAVVDARIGQGKYRKDLLEKWGNACSVTGCRTEEALRASHAKPWIKCESAGERISSDNGLILTANLDALFDKGLISFKNNGKIMISEKVKEEDRERLGLSGNLQLKSELNENQKRFLKYHRQHVWVDR